MGRYYHGDIEGKFWFGVQPSNVAETVFGGEIVDESYEEYEEFNEDTGENETFIEEGFYTTYLVRDKEYVDKVMIELVEKLGEYKEKLDTFFNEHNGYNEMQLIKVLFNVDIKYGEKNYSLYSIKLKLILQDYANCYFGLKLQEAFKTMDEIEIVCEN